MSPSHERKQGDPITCAVPATQAQVVEAGAPHLLVRRAALVAEHLRAEQPLAP